MDERATGEAEGGFHVAERAFQPPLPADWQSALAPALASSWFAELFAFVTVERRTARVYPAADHVLAAFAATPLERVRVVILGQDPYHGPGQAHGLSFSVPRGVPAPPSLANMLRELGTDVGAEALRRSPTEPPHGCLSAWAERGILLLNTVLTVRDGEPNSHARHGWERFTDAAIGAVSSRPSGAVFLLWGASAQKKRKLVDERRHRVIAGVHPSPLSAYRGFFGSKPYSATNRALVELGQSPVDWSLD